MKFSEQKRRLKAEKKAKEKAEKAESAVTEGSQKEAEDKIDMENMDAGVSVCRLVLLKKHRCQMYTTVF